jgi:hypothetical protein
VGVAETTVGLGEEMLGECQILLHDFFLAGSVPR